MNAFKQLFLANLREFVRDRMSLFFTLAFPIMFILLFGVIFAGDNKINATVGLAVADQGPVGLELAKTLESLPKQQPVEDNLLSGLKFERGAQADLEARLKTGDLDAVIIIPAGASVAASDQPAAVELLIDQSSQVLGPLLRGVVGGVVEQTDRAITNSQPALTLAVRPVLSENLRQIDLLIPGILCMSIMNLGLFGTAQPMIAMRTQGVLKRLGATPLPRATVLAAYVALRLVIACLQTALTIGIGVLVFDVAVVGSWLAFAAWTLLGTLTFIAIGFFIAAIAKTEESGTALTNLLNFPMLFLSGVFFSVNASFLQPIVKAIPLTYFVDALRQTMINAPPVNPLWVDGAVLAAWLVVMTALSVRFFRWDAR
ncbi:MAG TPA: ABC transporter permease [Herpetosiphonaceae bacterium]